MLSINDKRCWKPGAAPFINVCEKERKKERKRRDLVSMIRKCLLKTAATLPSLSLSLSLSPLLFLSCSFSFWLLPQAFVAAEFPGCIETPLDSHSLLLIPTVPMDDNFNNDRVCRAFSLSFFFPSFFLSLSLSGTLN